MSIFIDRTFLLRISTRLERFTRKSEDLYNFRCPICGDSHKNKTKTRGYVYRKKNDYFYRCHNCGLSTTFYNFLKQIAPVLCKEYTLERYKNGETHNHNYTKPEFEELKTLPVFKKKLDLPSIESLQEEHFAKQYVLNRKIPKSFMSELYFAEDFKKFVISVGIEKDLHNNDQRLVIPFYNKDGHLIAFQGRALGESSIRYITIKLNGDDPKAFGLNRIDEKEMIYVMEGPIDSMFIKNSVAMANSMRSASSRRPIVLPPPFPRSVAIKDDTLRRDSRTCGFFALSWSRMDCRLAISASSACSKPKENEPCHASDRTSRD